MKSYSFLFWGYLVVWAGLVVYFALLARRIADVGRRLDALERKTKATA
ncbi:MAG TPA: CcmD family protein [Candidatus Polarisedimenticolaceae bacterium]|nr:CcmD family protein [Candidatus Polarisedimenticolaceae bacterium]